MIRRYSQKRKAKLIKKLDDLWSEFVRKEMGRCERCGGSYILQCHHIFTRTRYVTRWHRPNLMCLCKQCHLGWVHGTGTDTDDVIQFYYSKIGEDQYHEMKRNSKISLGGYSEFEVGLMIIDIKRQIKELK